MAVLKSRQAGTVQILASTDDITVTITSVDTTKSFLIFSYRNEDNTPSEVITTGEITNATTLTFTRHSSGATFVVDIAWYVVEFSSGVTVQRGSQTMNATTQDITITAVDLAKSFPIISYRNSSVNFGDDDFVRAKITTTTNLQLTIDTAGGANSIANWQVIEYDNCSVQTGDISFLTTDASKTDTLSPAVNIDRSWLILSYKSASGTTADIGQKMIRGQVTNSTTLTFDRDNTGQTLDLTWYLVEFTDRTLVQHASENFGTGDLTKNVTIENVTLARSIAATAGYYNSGGKTAFNSDDIPGVALATAELTTSTNLKLDRATTQTTAADIEWFVIEFGRRVFVA